jgi:6-phosphofructokinase 1
MKKKIGILTGGGDVQALNTVLASAKNEAQVQNLELIGFIKGWEGLLERNFLDLSKQRFDPAIGGTFLKSSRININKVENGGKQVVKNLEKLGISGLIVVGGEDTLSNYFSIISFPQVLISKTIDNDVGSIKDGFNREEFVPDKIINFFTLGFPTAAEKIISFVSLREGLRTTAYSHERIIVVESMGMHTGWLALSSGLGYPDFIIIPEFPLDYERFLEDVLKAYSRQKHLIIVVAEGAKWADGSYIHAEKDESEDFSHPRFGGAANTLKTQLKRDLAKYLNPRNINAVNPSYLYRAGAPNALDQYWGQKLGEKAVRLLAEGIKETRFLAIQWDEGRFTIKDFPLSQFKSINELHRFVDDRLYDAGVFHITESGKKYMKEILKEIPLEKSYGISGFCHGRQE